MALPGTAHLEVYAGDRAVRTLTFKDANEDPIDMSGATLAAQIRPRGGGDALAELDINDDDAETGIIILTLAAADATTDLDGARWDLEDTTAERTYLTGNVTVRADVTDDA